MDPCQLRRNGTLPGGSPPKQHFGLQLGELSFQALEHGLCWITDAGEEVVLIAGKGDEA
ncbi:hypothetical protein LM599_00140 [Candidatus Acetothermia bacterium]|nr:hypothetical protein [Candidatus Acetothermia bacterium]